MDSGESQSELAERSRRERQEIVAKYDKGRQIGAKIDDWEDPIYDECHKIDRYGFIHNQNLFNIRHTERERKSNETEAARAIKWNQMFKKEDDFFLPRARSREKMINRIYKGVPLGVRGKLWEKLLGIKELKEVNKNVYKRMKDIARKHSPDIRQIDLDVNRTYRDHEFFVERYNLRQKALFHVLAAYSVYNTEVGYCQGMSQIAALLLIYLNDEEDAFWGLQQLMNSEKYAMHGFFIHGFPKLLRFQQHHDKVMKKFLPKLKKHLDKQGIDSGIYTLKWFFQCFLDRIPFSLTLRVWDLYLLEGERVLIAMAYTILWLHRKNLMKMPMDEAVEHLQMTLAKDFGYDDDTVIEKLREHMHDLRSHRLDYPGKPPQKELPEKPFGLFDIPEDYTEEILPMEQKPKEWTVEKEAGLRKGFTEKEREFSQNAIQRQQQNYIETLQPDIEEDDEDDTGHGNSFDDSSQMRALRSTSAGGQDFDTSFDASDIIPSNGGEDDDEDVVHILSKSPLPPSKEQDILDNSLRDMLKVASELEYDHVSCGNSSKSSQKLRRPRSHLVESSKLDNSFEEMHSGSVERSASNSDVVRIRVPFSREDALKSAADQNKIRISVLNGSENKSFNHIIKSNSKSMTNL